MSKKDGPVFYRIAAGGRFVRFNPGVVMAGFPSPAEDYAEEDIDLVHLLGMDKPSVFVMRASGNSMIDAGVLDKSYLVVDRSLTPQPGDIVVALLNGEFTVKELVKSTTGWLLYPQNHFYEPIVVKPDDHFQVWGVVAQVVIDRREMRKRR